MKIKAGFVKKKIASKNVVVSVGDGSAGANKVIVLNDTASFIFDMLKDGATRDELISAIIDEFEDAEQDIVADDVDYFIDKLRGAEMLIDD